MVVSTREHGRVQPFYTSLAQFNRGVVYVPVDTAKYYVLDATGKYNMYNETRQSCLTHRACILINHKTNMILFF